MWDFNLGGARFQLGSTLSPRSYTVRWGPWATYGIYILPGERWLSFVGRAVFISSHSILSRGPRPARRPVDYDEQLRVATTPVRPAEAR